MSARVLVVDDSITMRKLVLRSLGAWGAHAAVEAADGAEAIARFKPGEFDLVLTDWNMPGKSGLDVVQEIHGQDANVKIIMVTAEAEKDRVRAALAAGACDYLVKPITADALRETLEKHGLVAG
ncbi:MAG: response regulator [Terriglobales bacterium]